MAFEQAAVKKHKPASPDALVDCASRAEDGDIISRIQWSVRGEFHQRGWSPKEGQVFTIHRDNQDTIVYNLVDERNGDVATRMQAFMIHITMKGSNAVLFKFRFPAAPEEPRVVYHGISIYKPSRENLRYGFDVPFVKPDAAPDRHPTALKVRIDSVNPTPIMSRNPSRRADRIRTS